MASCHYFTGRHPFRQTHLAANETQRIWQFSAPDRKIMDPGSDSHRDRKFVFTHYLVERPDLGLEIARALPRKIQILRKFERAFAPKEGVTKLLVRSLGRFENWEN